MCTVLDSFCKARGSVSHTHTWYVTSHSTSLDFNTLICCGGQLTNASLCSFLLPIVHSSSLQPIIFDLHCIVYSLTSYLNKLSFCISPIVGTVHPNFSTICSRWVCIAVLQSEQEGNPKYSPAYCTGNSWGNHYSDRQQDPACCPL